MPLNGRNAMQLAILAGGVQPRGTNADNGGPNIIGPGGRPTETSYLIEGTETRKQRTGN